MQDLTTKVQIALEAYLHWGRLAVEALVEERGEAFFAAMEQRDLAFAAVHALDSEAPIVQTAALHALWLQIDQVNRTLLGHMARMQGDLRQQLGQGPVLRLVKSA